MTSNDQEQPMATSVYTAGSTTKVHTAAAVCLECAASSARTYRHATSTFRASRLHHPACPLSIGSHCSIDRTQLTSWLSRVHVTNSVKLSGNYCGSSVAAPAAGQQAGAVTAAGASSSVVGSAPAAAQRAASGMLAPRSQASPPHRLPEWQTQQRLVEQKGHNLALLGDEMSSILQPVHGEDVARLFALGRNSEGQLGVGRPTPMVTPSGEQSRFAALEAAEVQEQERFFKWPEEAKGVDVVWSPHHVEIPALRDTPVVFVAAGATHCVAIDADGSLWGWGSNKFGQARLTVTRPPSAAWAS
eukprot:GHVT01014087.1.p1 GENE.GHVT01014087.1~~GHVT01014087.1.p1  ORF type:complete len:302 (-),score=56.88 GHVT01014087.1:4040-4945(-)